VTIAQRAAWAQADAAARTAEADEQAARDAKLRKARAKARRHPPASGTGQDPETGGSHGGDGPDGDGPGGDGLDGDGSGAQAGAPDQDGNPSGSPDGSEPDGDGKCSFPACSRHARESDFEHATAYAKGGRTCGCNAHCASRSCHHAKQSPGWQVTKPRPGWTRWTTKAGRVYQQGPWRYPA
jgi:hypothetical protein